MRFYPVSSATHQVSFLHALAPSLQLPLCEPQIRTPNIIYLQLMLSTTEHKSVYCMVLLLMYDISMTQVFFGVCLYKKMPQLSF
jgi:hypothetical protein